MLRVETYIKDSWRLVRPINEGECPEQIFKDCQIAMPTAQLRLVEMVPEILLESDST